MKLAAHVIMFLPVCISQNKFHTENGNEVPEGISRHMGSDKIRLEFEPMKIDNKCLTM
jgi:hypothetical protein